VVRSRPPLVLPVLHELAGSTLIASASV
jgi:hypothetical protein